MEFLQRVPLYTVILIIGCEGDPYFNKENNLKVPDDHEMSWMKSIDDETPLSAVTIPGTYQSMKMNIHDQHQAWKITAQFKAGVRFFDISLSGSVVKDGSTSKRKFADVMEKMEECVKSHRQEVILVRVSPKDRKAEEEIKRYTKDNGKVWKSTQIPKMKEVRGKIVFVESLELKEGIVTHVHEGGKQLKSAEENMKKIKEHLKKAEKANGYIVVTETSAYYGLGRSVQQAAIQINPMLHKHIDDLLKLEKPPTCLGVIVMDFPGLDLIQKIIAVNPKPGVSPESSAKEEEGEEEAENPPESEGENE